MPFIPSLADDTVGVIGSGHDAHEALSRAIGQLLADLEVNLLTGGGRGVMEAVSRAFVLARQGRGVCIGIIPCREEDPATPQDGYPNAFVELPIFTHLPFSGERGHDMLSRNHINVLSCVALVALPGEAGTVAEASLAVRYWKPLVVYSPNVELASGFPATVPRADSPFEVRRFLMDQLRPGRQPWRRG